MRERFPLMVVKYALAFSLLFAILGSAFIGKAGLGHDEGWHAETTISLIDSQSAVSISFWRAMPWMRDSYNGALKTYILYLPFRVFGIGVETLRWTTLLIGACALFCLVLLIARLYGAYLGFFFGLVFATDPALILAACFDTGPAIFMLLLKICGLWLMVEWWYRDKPGWLFSAGLMFGLALSDKAHFVWFLVALPLCAFLAPWNSLRLKFTANNLSVGFLGFFIGAFPFIVFNLRNSFLSYRVPGIVGDPLQQLGELPFMIELRWRSLKAALEGSGQYAVAGTVFPRSISLILSLWAWILATLLPFCVWHKGLAALRHVWFWLSLAALIFFAACLSPVPVKWHHLYTTYPFSHLAFIALFFHILKRYKRVERFRHLCIIPLALMAVMNNAVVIRSFRHDLIASGGTLQFYRGISLVFEWLDNFSKDNPGTRIFADDGFQSRLCIYSRGRLRLDNLAPGPAVLPLRRIHVDNCFRLLKFPGSVILLHIPVDGGREPYSSSDAIGFLKIGLEPMELFRLADGRPWAGIYRMRSPMMTSFLKAGQACKEREIGQMRRYLQEGLNHWDSIFERISRIEEAPENQDREIIRTKSGLMFLLEGVLETLPSEGRIMFLNEIACIVKDPQSIIDVLIGRASLALNMRRRQSALSMLDKIKSMKLDSDQAGQVADLYKRLTNDAFIVGENQPSLISVRGGGRAGVGPATLIDSAEQALESRDRQAAAEALSLAEKHNPNNEDWHRISLVYQDLGRCDRALAILERLVSENPNSSALYSDKGICEHIRGLSREAIADLQRAIALDPSKLPAYLTLGSIYSEKGKFREALDVYERALSASGNRQGSLEDLIRGSRKDVLLRMEKGKN